MYLEIGLWRSLSDSNVSHCHDFKFKVFLLSVRHHICRKVSVHSRQLEFFSVILQFTYILSTSQSLCFEFHDALLHDYKRLFKQNTSRRENEIASCKLKLELSLPAVVSCVI